MHTLTGVGKTDTGVTPIKCADRYALVHPQMYEWGLVRARPFCHPNEHSVAHAEYVRAHRGVTYRRSVNDALSAVRDACLLLKAECTHRFFLTKYTALCFPQAHGRLHVLLMRKTQLSKLVFCPTLLSQLSYPIFRRFVRMSNIARRFVSSHGTTRLIVRRFVLFHRTTTCPVLSSHAYS